MEPSSLVPSIKTLLNTIPAPQNTSKKNIKPLPPEILTEIFRLTLTEPPLCAFQLFCPDWRLCRPPDAGLGGWVADARRTHAANSPLCKFRVDTYTLPPSGRVRNDNHDDHSRPKGGTLTSTFGRRLHQRSSTRAKMPQESCGKLIVPNMEDPRTRPEVPPIVRGELFRTWVRERVVVVPRYEKKVPDDEDMFWGCWRVSGGGGYTVLVRDRASLGALPWEDDLVGAEDGRVLSVDGVEKDIYPSTAGAGNARYVYQRVRHLVVNAMLMEFWDHYIERDELPKERRISTIGLRWAALEHLETLCLDLRGYTIPDRRQYLQKEDLIRLSRALQGKGLRLLVIAGLRSYESYPGPDLLGIDEVERAEWSEEEGVWGNTGDWQVFKLQLACVAYCRTHPITSATLTLKALDPRRLNFTLTAPTGRLTIAEIEHRFWGEYAQRASPIPRAAILTLYDSYCRPLPRNPSAILRIDHPLTVWYQLTANDQPPRWKFTHRSDHRDKSLEGPFWDRLRQAIDAGETVSELKKRIARDMGLADANRVSLIVMDGIRRGTLHGNHWTLYHLRTAWLCRWLAIDTGPSHGYIILRGLAGAEYMWYPHPSKSKQQTFPLTPTAGFLCEYLATRVIPRVHRRDRSAIAPGTVDVRLWRFRRSGGRDEVCAGDVLRWGATYDFEVVDQEVVRVFLQEEAWLQREDRTCGLCFETRRRADMVLWRVARGCAHTADADACCRECMAQHLRITLDSAGWERLRCPMCNASMGWEDVRACAPREVFERFDGLLARAALGGMEDFHYCLGSGCRSGQVQDGEECPKFVCVACRHRHCIRHNMPWHDGETCEEYDERNQERQRAEELSEEVAQMETMPCPGCNRPVAKDEGCNHIRCICGSEWCYHCGGLWVKDETGLSRCNHQPDCPSRPGAAWPVRPLTPEDETDDEFDGPEEVPMRSAGWTLRLPPPPPPPPERRDGSNNTCIANNNTRQSGSSNNQSAQPRAAEPDRPPTLEDDSDTESDAPEEAPMSTGDRTLWQTLEHQDDTDDEYDSPDEVPMNTRDEMPLQPPSARGDDTGTNTDKPNVDEDSDAPEEGPMNTDDRPRLPLAPERRDGGNNTTSIANDTAQKSSSGNKPSVERHVTWQPEVPLTTTALGLRLTPSRRRAQLRAARQQRKSSENVISQNDPREQDIA
ncbi:hypothetical protein VTJ49DRAFT_3244 [Mycothermus thermophilus]|uniref:RBR-type E3 ubiquitin transferase n=1 Tax=Humicola insolens TaxID=85995 RepID=A0ABR3V7Z0_HUMIN